MPQAVIYFCYTIKIHIYDLYVIKYYNNDLINKISIKKLREINKEKGPYGAHVICRDISYRVHFICRDNPYGVHFIRRIISSYLLCKGRCHNKKNATILDNVPIGWGKQTKIKFRLLKAHGEREGGVSIFHI